MGLVLQVYRGRYAGFEVAVKELFSASLNRQNRKESFQEAEILSRVRHPNIVMFYGVNITANRFQLCTELCQDGLDRLLLRKSVVLDKMTICVISLQIAYVDALLVRQCAC
mgnify:CR=1 FL=1